MWVSASSPEVGAFCDSILFAQPCSQQALKILAHPKVPLVATVGELREASGARPARSFQRATWLLGAGLEEAVCPWSVTASVYSEDTSFSCVLLCVLLVC